MICLTIKHIYKYIQSVLTTNTNLTLCYVDDNPSKNGINLTMLINVYVFFFTAKLTLLNFNSLHDS